MDTTFNNSDEQQCPMLARLRNFSHLPKSVWSLGYCGLAFLTLSFSHFDPELTFAIRLRPLRVRQIPLEDASAKAVTSSTSRRIAVRSAPGVKASANMAYMSGSSALSHRRLSLGPRYQRSRRWK